ncbi:MAG: lysophospholipid acyltransferase family protein [Actinomycetota bacterium]|nr:lysophospholipid acyltransferase family protein [Actinomycetota bacterium]
MELKNKLFYEFMRLTFGPMFTWHFRLKCDGADNVPEVGGAILVCNHRSLLDPPILVWEVDRYINFAAAAFSFQIPGSAQLYRWAGGFPLSIEGGKESDQQLEYALKLLEEGELVGIFPEGVESFTNPHRVNRITQFKTGFVRLAWEAGVPIIPAAIAALEEHHMPSIPGPIVKRFFPHEKAGKGMAFIAYKHVRVRIGRPVDLGTLYDQALTKVEFDRISGRIRRIVIKLYNGEDLDRFLYGTKPFDIIKDRV